MQINGKEFSLQPWLYNHYSPFDMFLGFKNLLTVTAAYLLNTVK